MAGRRGPRRPRTKREVDADDTQSPAAHNELGDRLWQYGRTAEAESAYRQALQRLEKLCSAFPDDPAYQQELVRSLLSVSLLLRVERDRHPDAEPARLRALEAYRKLSLQHQQAMLFAYGERRRKLSVSNNAQQADRTHSQMIELMPQDDVAWLARAMNHLSRCPDARLRDTSRAVEFGRQAAALARIDRNELAPEGRKELAGALAYVGVALERDKRHAEALEHYWQAVDLWKELSVEYPDNEWYRHERAYFSLALAILLQTTGRAEAALEHCRTSVGLNEQLVADFPDKPDHRSRLAYGRGVLISLLSSLGRDEEIETEVEALLKGKPSAEGLNNFAWAIVSRSGASVHSARLASEMAKKAVELNPQAGHMWNTLGIAQYRAGNWKDAIAALDQSRELRKGGDGFNWFFLAMALWQLDSQEEARKWYDQAVVWMDKNQPKTEELRRFRAEAEELMGIKQNKE